MTEAARTLADAITEYAHDLRRNSSGGDEYPWELLRSVADCLDAMVARAAAQSSGMRERTSICPCCKGHIITKKFPVDCPSCHWTIRCLPGTREEVARASAGTQDREAAKALLTEIIAFFSTTQDGLGDGWAHPDDYTSYGLDYRHRNGTQLWLDLEDDGTIHVLWKPAGQDKPTIMYFHALPPAPMPEREGIREAHEAFDRMLRRNVIEECAKVADLRFAGSNLNNIGKLVGEAIRALASHDDKGPAVPRAERGGEA